MNPAILAYVALPGQFPAAIAARLRATVPYGRRMRLSADSTTAGASLLGIALARQLIGEVQGVDQESVRLRFPYGEKPVCPGGPDFSISHSGGWLAVLVCADTRVGLDIETDAPHRPAALIRDLADWTAREAMIKACGARLDRVREVHVAETFCRWQQQHWHLARPPAPEGVNIAIVSGQPLAISVRELSWQSLAGSASAEAACA